jgi:hypothetical protein
MYYTPAPFSQNERTLGVSLDGIYILFVSAAPTPELWAASAFVHATRQSQAGKITFSRRAAGKVLPRRAPPPHRRESRRESDKLQSQTRGGLIALQLAREAERNESFGFRSAPHCVADGSSPMLFSAPTVIYFIMIINRLHTRDARCLFMS